MWGFHTPEIELQFTHQTRFTTFQLNISITFVPWWKTSHNKSAHNVPYGQTSAAVENIVLTWESFIYSKVQLKWQPFCSPKRNVLFFCFFLIIIKTEAKKSKDISEKFLSLAACKKGLLVSVCDWQASPQQGEQPQASSSPRGPAEGLLRLRRLTAYVSPHSASGPLREACKKDHFRSKIYVAICVGRKFSVLR